MSTPPQQHPAYGPAPGPGAYPQAPAPGPYHQAPASGPYQQPYHHAPGPAPCQICGAVPAAPVTVRGHQGMLVIMRFLKREGVFCRTCALASFRDMQADTMVLGWWGPLSVLITPFTLLANLGALSGIRRIPEPVAPGFRPPLDPGKPVFKRPAGILALIPMGLLGLAVFAFTVLLGIGLVTGGSHSADHPTLTVGSCARNDATWPEQDLAPESCDSSDAELRVTTPTDDSCAAGDYLAYLEYSEDGHTSLCLHRLKG
ncbi:LppU/SCO3897 family protein [Streptomyces griseorubiginosus]|uniref:LppU/SCO3897 family protein n=1 Tax=Streptomyces griseorubiginosus TaxID=67304 RepID=UPI0036EA533D